jgi:uncharacterized protein YbjT (DUF2867 family)
MKTAIVIGGSGLVGKQLIYQLLNDAHYQKVIALTRKDLVLAHSKLEQLIVDFDQLSDIQHQLLADDVFCCIGTTKAKTPNEANYTRIDHGIPLEIAKYAKANGATQFVLVSAMGANEKSMVFYSRLKAKVETDLAAIGFDALQIIRPALLMGARTEFRLFEKIFQWLFKPLNLLMIGPLKAYKGIAAITVAKAMLNIALQKPLGVHVWTNDQLFGQAATNPK